MRTSIIIAVLLVSLPSIGFSACGGSSPNLVADSCNNNVTDGYDIQDCIDSAVTGDTISVPSGSCTFDTSVDIDVDGVIIEGAGIGNTVISSSVVPFSVTATDDWRLTGFELNISAVVRGVDINAGTGWRIDHCEFDHSTASGKTYGVSFDNQNHFYPTYTIEGLVDNCTFIDSNSYAGGSAYARSSGHAYHSAPLGLGTSEAIYFEDCTFTTDLFGNLIDSNRSGAYVIRFSTITKNGNQTGSVFEAHSLQADNERGTKKWEIYGNTVNIDQGDIGNLRAGTGMFFNNDLNITAGGDDNITVSNYRDTTSLTIMGDCDGTESDYDSNEDGGWLCRDQVGSGADQSTSDGTTPYPSQDKAPAYFFNNDPGITISTSTNVQEDRDYFLQGGTVGVGVGVVASLPVSCTTGEGYWATDEGEWNSNSAGADGRLYKCTSTDNWEVYYTPYTYPHPLRIQATTQGSVSLMQ